MNIEELEDKLEGLCSSLDQESFIFQLLEVYDFPKSRISMLKADSSGSVGSRTFIIKNRLYFREISEGEDEHFIIDDLSKEKNVLKFKPRFIVVTDYKILLAIDTKTGENIDIEIGDLHKHYAFFAPWVGQEKVQITNENPADVRAASKMSKLFDQIVKDDPKYIKKNLHDLNVFFSRLLFCFFAEDTRVFNEGVFSSSIATHTQKDGNDLKEYFEQLFQVLNLENREGLPKHFNEFPYVNGGLFEKTIALPAFGEISRDIILECGKLDWSEINPDIFGSMIQAVVNPSLRENLGMHYTSVPNIMKVIQPLFLDELWAEFFACEGSKKKLIALKERIAGIRIFDPACGSGNFLIISYKELCRLEAEILKELNQVKQDGFDFAYDESLSTIRLNNFYGIEIDDFASEVAKLSLYLAQHQVNMMFERTFGKLKPILPLKESGNILNENATRVAWDKFCPRKDESNEEHETYLAGNPPYLGSRNQDKEQKDDLEYVFKKDYKSLDYISAWFYKGAQYMAGYENVKLAFVSTNSIAQGEQVALLWPRIFEMGGEIFFAHQSFKWQNNAKHNAGVTVVIIGLSNPLNQLKRLYSENQYVAVKEINPYLKSTSVVNVTKRSVSISNLPEMTYGNMPLEGNFLKLNLQEKAEILLRYPDSIKFIRPLIGGSEFLNSTPRFCLWIEDVDLNEANAIPDIKKRIESVHRFRESGGDVARTLTGRSHQFRYRHEAKKYFMVVPCTSSENREYMPCGIFDSKFISLNSLQVIYDADLYVFGILVSRMHMVWVRAVGGRLKTDLRYSSALCYNTFPFPPITDEQKKIITHQVHNVLDEREKYSEKTMAELYDPEKMPDGLRDAHYLLDEVIDRIYRQKPFENDEERLAHLFKLYESMIQKEAEQKSLKPKAKK